MPEFLEHFEEQTWHMSAPQRQALIDVLKCALTQAKDVDDELREVLAHWDAANAG